MLITTSYKKWWQIIMYMTYCYLVGEIGSQSWSILKYLKTVFYQLPELVYVWMNQIWNISKKFASFHILGLNFGAFWSKSWKWAQLQKLEFLHNQKRDLYKTLNKSSLYMFTSPCKFWGQSVHTCTCKSIYAFMLYL